MECNLVLLLGIKEPEHEADYSLLSNAWRYASTPPSRGHGHFYCKSVSSVKPTSGIVHKIFLFPHSLSSAVQNATACTKLLLTKDSRRTVAKYRSFRKRDRWKQHGGILI
jgi:hypothetical protein